MKLNLAKTASAVLLGLNSTALYVGVSIAGVLGAAGIAMLDRHLLGVIAVVPIALALVLAQPANRRIRSSASAVLVS